MDIQEEDKQIQIVYDQIKDIVGDRMDLSDIIVLVTHLIPIVQKVIVGKHQGAYKKYIVISVIEMVVRDSNLDDDDKNTLKVIVNITIPPTIDIMINIANGKIDLAKHAKKCFTCFI